VSFWDSSAILPLLVREPASGEIHLLARRLGARVVWWGTLVECFSALSRLHRAGSFSLAEMQRAASRLLALADSWVEVLPVEAVRSTAVRLISVHELRAADAVQLAAAMEWAEQRPAGRAFVCLDARLRNAALREGFRVLPEETGGSPQCSIANGRTPDVLARKRTKRLLAAGPAGPKARFLRPASW